MLCIPKCVKFIQFIQINFSSITFYILLDTDTVGDKVAARNVVSNHNLTPYSNLLGNGTY